VPERVITLFFEYMQGQVEFKEDDHVPKLGFWRWFGLKMRRRSTQRQAEWFRQNVGVDVIQKLFAAAISVDDLVKKNATTTMTKTGLKSQEESSEPKSQTNLELVSSESTATPSSSLEL
jgi:hypothetical protein